jgi:hypothetical protein
MTAIDVATKATGRAGWTCRVTLTDGDGSRTEHEVRVSTADLERYAPGAGEPADLVRRSFGFLLEREPKESILPAFDLPVIERYFPEYPRVIRARG